MKLDFPLHAMLATVSMFLSMAGATAQTDAPQLRESITQYTTGGPLTLPQVEDAVMKSNPTVSQSQANVTAAQGRQRQAGMLPNPVVGGEVENFAFRFLNKKPTYLGFAVQTIPLGGKLKKMRSVYGAEVSQAQVAAEAQRQRVTNMVRSLFYRVLGAQQILDLRTELATIARDAVTTTSELYNVGQADKPDYLESAMEKETVEHELVAARNNYLQAWRILAVLLGHADMPATRLSGNLEDRIQTADEQHIYQRYLAQSPQIRAAQAQIQRARAVLVRAQAEPIPDLYVRGAMGYSTEYLDTGSEGKPPRTGLLANAQVGVTLPIFNRNQGGIASARSELQYVEREVERVRMQLRIQVASAVREYNTALDAVNRYKNVIIPRADEAYELQKNKFAQMSASYPQVLIANRTRYQMRERYIENLVKLQQTGTQIEGFLLGGGGLDAPSGQFEMASQSATGLTGMYTSEEADINSLDEAHNVDHY